MVNYYIYAKDFSGSTDGVEYYHSNGLKTLKQFKRDVEKIKEELLIAKEPPTKSKIIYLHWGYNCYEVDENTTIATYKNLEGNERLTNPSAIINWLQNNYDSCSENSKIKLLYIITDGLIDHESTEKCFQLNGNMHYETVVYHAFNEDPKEIDLSVATSFFKSRCIIHCNTELHDCTDISKEFDYDKINAYNFSVEREELKSYIKLKFIKKFTHDAVALQEIDKLKKLRDKLLNELSSETSDKSKCYLETKDRDKFLHEFVNMYWYKNLTASVHVNKVDIEKSISILINYIVSDVKSYSFDALKFDTKFDKSVDEEEIVDINFTTEQEIEFPDIILDDEKGIPVIILTKFNLMNKIIFHGRQSTHEATPASFSKFKSTMTCPLFLVNDQDISESIGYFYTLNVYKQLLANNSKTEPRTRRPFHGSLVLTDVDQFDNYNDYILSATYFSFKKINYNVGLFYYVLWKNCENKEWMDRNVVEQFKKYTMRRISETVCKIGLSALPLDPQVNTSLLTALWYCVELSSCIFKNDPQNFMHERMRMYYGVAHYMIEILKHFNYDLHLESIEKRRDLVSHVMALKKIQTLSAKVYYLLKKIFKTVDCGLSMLVPGLYMDFPVSEIEKPFNLHILNYLKLNHKEMLRDDVVEEKVHLNDYVNLMYFDSYLETTKAGEGKIEICKKTLRPFFAIDQNTSFYTKMAKITKKVVINYDDDKDKIKVTYEAIDSLEFDRVLSLYKLYINCVKELKKYPTLPEYVDYVFVRKIYYDGYQVINIFPSNFYSCIKDVYECYQNVVSNVEVEEFIKVCKANANRIERIKAEERVKFNSDNEIDEFISSEELKVNLKKRTFN